MITVKSTLFKLTPIAFLALLACTAKSSYAESSADATATASLPVIYETDMTLDVDDVGALAVLHGLQEEGRVTLLGVCYNEVHPLGPSAIDAINTYYGCGTIPIGIYKNYRADFKDPDPSDYYSHERDFDVDNMPHDPFDNIVGNAVAVYKHLLKTQADNSVVIISVGFLNNLHDLLKDPEGFKLVKRKVKLLAVMGGLHDDGFNLSRHNLVDQSQYVIQNWPGTLVITDDGGDMITGETLTRTTPVNNPVRRAYELEWKQGPNVGRSSWDQVTVLYAVYGTEYYMEDWDGNGRLRNGYSWTFSAGHRGYAVPRNEKEVEDEIERLMTLPVLSTSQDAQPKKIIYETNMCLAVDDVGALAMIHALQNRGEAELLAVCLNEVHTGGVPAIDAINTWYGRGEIPIGVYRGAFPDPDASTYLDDLAKFPHDLDDEDALSALEVYKEVLAKQPDKSVTIISTGFMNNLDVLLKNSPALVARKVKELVIMGSHNGDDHNLGFHHTAKAAQNVLEHWPSPLVFHHLGGDVMTGLGLKDTPTENPVRQAYYKYSGSKFVDLPSHDQMTVLYGVRGACNYFSKTSSGTGSLPSGFKWEMKTRNDSVIEALLPSDAYARIIEDLMTEAPNSLSSKTQQDLMILSRTEYKDKLRGFWLAEQARKRIPEWSYIADMYDFVKASHAANPDKNDWKKTRDEVSLRYQHKVTAGYEYKYPWDSGINFATSIFSLLYGEGNYKKTIRIGCMCGWDSDNPTATWGGLLGLLYGHKELQSHFNKFDFSDEYNISQTRFNMPIPLDELTFTGTAVQYYAYRSPKGGTVTIELDGISYGPFSQKDTSSIHGQYYVEIFELRDLAKVNHTIKIFGDDKETEKTIDMLSVIE